MTATLAGVLVERGLLSWETQIKEVFPDLNVHPDYEPVTLKQLLLHTGGFPTDPHDTLWEAIWEAENSPQEQRSKLVLPGLLSRAPEHETGKFSYSNAGYTVAGAMLERVSQTPFETLLQTELFQPLEMASAGFGAPAASVQLDQPYGHDPDPVEPGLYDDNPSATSPAGTVHMSITDFARHAAFHLTGEPKLLSQETLTVLHTPVLDDYALGWAVAERSWARGRTLTHAGSNGALTAVIWLAPAANSAFVSACNLGTEEGFGICDDAVGRLIERYLPDDAAEQRS